MITNSIEVGVRPDHRFLAVPLLHRLFQESEGFDLIHFDDL